jgi:YVTN family beta-propeller protein
MLLRQPVRVRTSLCFAAAAMCAALALPAIAHAEIHLLRTTVLGGEGGWDYLTYDGVGHRLFISRSTHVMVVDSDSLKVIGDIPNTPGVHGVALVQDLGRGFTSNGRDTSVTMFDLKSLQPLARIPVGRNPDAIVYDAASKRVFTMNGGSDDATAIDPATGTVVGTVALGGRPEEPACDGKGRMYVNLEDSSRIVTVDTQALKLLGRWPLAPGEEPTGISLDRANNRLFSGCSNNKLVVSDVKKGSVVTSLPIGSRVDGVGFDAARGLAFSSNGEGTLTVVRQDSPAKYRVVTNVPTALGARTLAFDPDAHRIFLVTAQFGPMPDSTAEQPRPRRPMLPGTFQLMVFGD